MTNQHIPTSSDLSSGPKLSEEEPGTNLESDRQDGKTDEMGTGHGDEKKTGDDRCDDLDPHIGNPERDNSNRQTVVIDGTKLVIHTQRNQVFQVDNSLKILFSSHPIRRTDRCVTYSTYVGDAPWTITVVDAGSTSQTFFPIVPALYGGTVYTRDGTAHVIVPGGADLKRSKVSSSRLPYRVCNKFVTGYVLKPKAQRLMTDLGGWIERPTWDPYVCSAPGEGGLVYVRGDSSMFRYPVTSQCNTEFHDGRVVAWSAGVDFKVTVTAWCCKKVTGAAGSGTIWIDNPRHSPSNQQPTFGGA